MEGSMIDAQGIDDHVPPRCARITYAWRAGLILRMEATDLMREALREDRIANPQDYVIQ